MAGENADLVRAQYERWNAAEFEAWIAAFDPEIVYTSAVVASTDGGGEYRGHDGLRRFIREFHEGWEQFQLEPTEYVEAGDRVAVVMRAFALGRGSGVRVDREIAHVWALRDGRPVHHESFTNRDDALAALGRGE